MCIRDRSTGGLQIVTPQHRHKMRFSVLIVVFASLCLLGQALKAPPTPPKPVWPLEFDVTFGLTDPLVTNMVNVTSHFYYNFNIFSSLIDYQEQCIPTPIPATSTQYPCSILFNNVGTYFIQSQTNLCCLFFADVGPVPPNFLKGFNYTSNNQTAKDYFGNVHDVNYWTGPGGFGYWTDITTGHDVQFLDGGGSEVYWNFAPFNVASQQNSTFALPEGQDCSSPCPSSGNFEIRDPYLNAALSFYGVGF
eukprot:TRINITY_DN451_c0_g1_i1.p1 TRINITY_DN451_c0_g1~~TRINITY_DN451_c0_g1_i1.p1  ORF type:complete len:249 (+),score=60.88 TRINITY_DN451_c0_g1_i1:53-799(+)